MTRWHASALVLATGALLAAAGHAQTSKDLAAPERLTADGKVIDHGQYIGHTGPLLVDVDRDGLVDLLVGSFRGHAELFANTGTRKNPEFTSKGLLPAGGEPLLIHNW